MVNKMFYLSFDLKTKTDIFFIPLTAGDFTVFINMHFIVLNNSENYPEFRLESATVSCTYPTSQLPVVSSAISQNVVFFNTAMPVIPLYTCPVQLDQTAVRYQSQYHTYNIYSC